MPRRNRELQVGDAAPTFELRDAATGESVSLQDQAGKPLVLVFGRGTW
jgi:peroxiredoxin